jgi:DNA repair photolyase
VQSEGDWITQDEATQEAYRYYMRNDPSTREFLGDIETKFDPVTGREMRMRAARVGTVRGARPENMRDATVYLDPVPHIRLDTPKPLQGWYSSKGDGLKPGGRERERPCMTDAILTQPYGGWCSVGCHAFCYVMAGHYGYRASGLTSVPLGYGEYVRRALSSMPVAQAGYFSSFTDPFMPIEEFYHNTEQGARAFVDAGLPIFFLSRLEYPDWAFDLMRRNPHSYMQKSINTPHEDDWRRLSPGAATLARHMDQIRQARAEGIYVSIQCNPVIPGVVSHEDIEHLIEQLAEAGAHHVIVKFVESNHAWRDSMVEKLTAKFGNNRMALFTELMVEKQSGNQTTITEEYRREGHTRYRKKATECGLTYSLCYEYTRRDGRWVSMGPEFLTADQCHGHRVPFYTRVRGTELQFRALEVCPPSGCLTCADPPVNSTGDGAGLCGSKQLGEARARKMRDMREDPGITVVS